jgi:signal transduction histidine kinase
VRYVSRAHVVHKGRALATRLPDGALFVVVQHSEAAESLQAILPGVVVAIFAGALLAGLAATMLFARQTALRLAETQAAADAIARGDLSRRIATDRLDGMFAHQAQSLNRMLDRMEELVNAQRQFSSALAHDLRTPLTRLRGLPRLGPAGKRRGKRERQR